MSDTWTPSTWSLRLTLSGYRGRETICRAQVDYDGHQDRYLYIRPLPSYPWDPHILPHWACPTCCVKDPHRLVFYLFICESINMLLLLIEKEIPRCLAIFEITMWPSLNDSGCAKFWLPQSHLRRQTENAYSCCHCYCHLPARHTHGTLTQPYLAYFQLSILKLNVLKRKAGFQTKLSLLSQPIFRAYTHELIVVFYVVETIFC